MSRCSMTELVRKVGCTRILLFAAVVATVLLTSCKPTQPWAEAKDSQSAGTQANQRRAAVHDLSLDEQRGGHTLRRHVGRSDLELQQRLRSEPDISAASTYTDRATAERVIAETLDRNRDEITRWMQRNRHPNLVLHYDGDQPIGRTLSRGEVRTRWCLRAMTVLRWDPPNGYHVLTSYPECR